MFILDLIEAQAKQTLVIIPGGFHPFHPGHLSLYRSAQAAFPGAQIYYVATDDRENRPFPFADKKKLAQIAGVNPKQFVLVKSPFAAKEITSQYDPNNTVLIFARSEKDRDEYPMPAKIDPKTGKLPLVTRGPRKGQPVSDYLQYYKKGADLAPFSEHAYMAYLPVVQFDAGPSGVTSATQIRQMWPTADAAKKAEIVQDLYPKNPKAAMQILDKYLGTAVAEAGATFRAGNARRAAVNAMSPEERKEYDEKRAEQQRKRDDARMERERQKNAAKKGVAESSVRSDRVNGILTSFDFYVNDDGWHRNGSMTYTNDITGEQILVHGSDWKHLKSGKIGNGPDELANFIYYTLRQGVAEESTAQDPNVIQMKKRARVAHPFAASDEEALALYVSDREIKDVDNLEREQEREKKMIDRIEQGENKLEQEIAHIDAILSQLANKVK